MAGTTGRPRDAQRARVYAAEDAWALRLDAARRGAPRATVAGSSVVLPAELRFGTLAAAQAYADDRLPNGLPPVLLRARKGQAQAHWEEPGTIALPLTRHGEPWALRETVLLHELAHHVAFHSDGSADHGPSYVTAMLSLVNTAMGEQAAFALRVDYAEVGVV
jgi:putative metallohydrolase (TIGR04338 family)